MMVRPDSTQSFARREAGGKGYNLWQLAQLGFRVPEFAVLGVSAWLEFVNHAQLEEPIGRRLQAFESGGANAEETATAIEQLIASAPLPVGLEAQVREVVRELGKESGLAVRSSAADEDCPTHSFAGQLSSFLYIPGAAEALAALKGCWSSAFSARALTYRRENRLPLNRIRIAVIFQEMLEAEKAGVLFTCDPVEQTLETFTVSALYGAGESLVSGAQPADTYWLDAVSGKLVKSAVVCKTVALSAKGRIAVKPEQQEGPCLTPEELGELHQLGLKLRETFPYPQDAEWVLAAGRLCLVQTRPVTTMEVNLTGYPNLWDNSNIVESYGGLTSPLSFTFALNNYKRVYVQFCEILGVPPAVIKDMDDYLSHMLGCINGRVYYNLYNWYKLVGVLPGFRQNRQFMETMMGVSESLAPEIADRIEPHPSWNTARGRWRKLVVGLKFAWYHFRAQKVVDDFLVTFHRDYLRYRRLDYARMSSDRIFQVYLEMERTMIGHWRAPIINDFLCMVHFGLLKKLTDRWLGDLAPNIQNDLLASEGNLESAEPTKELIQLASLVAADPALRKLVEETAAPDLLEALNQSAFQEFYHAILSYIDEFGFRCMSEMKLEETDLYADASYLFTCLKNYLRAGTTDLAAYEQREKALRRNAEEKVFEHLHGWRAVVYRWSLKHARRAVRNRENTRFARTRIYGVARAMFRAMGADLAGRRMLAQPEDIFYLTLEEIRGVHHGTLPGDALQELAEVRRRCYARYAAAEPSPRFLTRGAVYWGNRFSAKQDRTAKAPEEGWDLRGLPCCPGIVEGTVRVVTSPADDLNLNGEILVAPRTDPGWIPLYPSVAGLLVERGSLLSHSAIVAREMGLPTIVGVTGLTGTLRTGMRIRLDGQRGTIQILDHHAQ